MRLPCHRVYDKETSVDDEGRDHSKDRLVGLQCFGRKGKEYLTSGQSGFGSLFQKGQTFIELPLELVGER